MALPKLNSTLVYDTIVPSTRKKITYRPFSVGEEKLFLIATQTDSSRVLYDTVKRVVFQCVTTEGFTVEGLTDYDLEFIFLLLRAKSVGEKEELLIRCSHCQEENKIVVDFENMSYVRNLNAERNNKIQLENGVTIELKDLDASKILETQEKNETEVDQVFSIIDKMIDKVYTDDEVLVFADEKQSDRVAFVDSMSTSQLQLIMQYIESLPKVAMDVSFVCGKCETKNEHILEGISSFFT
jgi:hypothetical protein